MNTNSRKLIGWWLLLGVFIIMIQVLLGGITRLTGSGLSITQWNVLMGSLPPLNHEQWQHAFDQYKLFPQYKLMNAGMTLGGFKSIFWWEFAHRLWARMMGVVFVIPFVYFLSKKMISRQLAGKLIIIFFLGGLQGLLGWFMVASGLIDKPWVDPLMLSAHLVLALVLYCYLLWVALEVLQPLAERNEVKSQKKITTTIFALTGLQIFYGGLMAGNKAALFYPTFPKIGSSYIPDTIFFLQPWYLNLFANIAMIQLIHRSLGFIITLAIFYFYFRMRKAASAPLLKKAVASLPMLVIAQVLLGILTLINSFGAIPIFYAAMHQMCALLLLSTIVLIQFQLFNKNYSERKRFIPQQDPLLQSAERV